MKKTLLAVSLLLLPFTAQANTRDYLGELEYEKNVSWVIYKSDEAIVGVSQMTPHLRSVGSSYAVIGSSSMGGKTCQVWIVPSSARGQWANAGVGKYYCHAVGRKGRLSKPCGN